MRSVLQVSSAFISTEGCVCTCLHICVCVWERVSVRTHACVLARLCVCAHFLPCVSFFLYEVQFCSSVCVLNNTSLSASPELRGASVMLCLLAFTSFFSLCCFTVVICCTKKPTTYISVCKYTNPVHAIAEKCLSLLLILWSNQKCMACFWALGNFKWFKGGGVWSL